MKMLEIGHLGIFNVGKVALDKQIFGATVVCAPQHWGFGLY